MANSPAGAGTAPALARIEPRLLRTAAIGGLLGGLVMFLLMASYNASSGMGFLTIVNVCFAAWVFRGSAMTAMPAAHHAMGMHHKAMGMHHKAMGMHHKAMGMHHKAMGMHHEAMGMHHEAMGMHHHAMGTAAMMNQPLLASHLIVGGLLHLAMSAFAGTAFAVVLAVLIRAGLRVLDTPAGYVAAAVACGALLYVIMLYGFAPLWNTEIVNFTPRVPFFLSHLLFGAIAGGWVYWRLGHSAAGIPLRARRPQLGSTG